MQGTTTQPILLQRMLGWIRGLLTDPAHDPRPAPTTGEAWLVATAEPARDTVMYRYSSRQAAPQPAYC